MSGKQSTEVQVVQNNQQNQEVNVANQTVSDTLKGLVDVLNNQAKNPTTYFPINVIEQAAPAQGNNAYSDQTLSALLGLMYWNTSKGQQDTAKQGLPDNLITIFIAAAVVIIVVMVMRR